MHSKQRTHMGMGLLFSGAVAAVESNKVTNKIIID